MIYFHSYPLTIFGSLDAFLREPEKNFVFSSKFISSLKGINQKNTSNEEYISDAIVDEARNLATCTFEKGTEWGEEASIK